MVGNTPGNRAFDQRQAQEIFRWHAVEDKVGIGVETEPAVEPGLAKHDAAPGGKPGQRFDAVAYQFRPDALLLEFGNHADRAERVPIRAAVGDPDRRKGDMADHDPIRFGDQRHRQGAALAQRLDDEVLGLVTEGMKLERPARDAFDGTDVGGGFRADDDIHDDFRFLAREAAVGMEAALYHQCTERLVSAAKDQTRRKSSGRRQRSRPDAFHGRQRDV